MTYQITKQIRIKHTEDDWDFVFTTDEYGTVEVRYNENLIVMPASKNIDIPQDCIQHFIDALEQMK